MGWRRDGAARIMVSCRVGKCVDPHKVEGTHGSWWVRRGRREVRHGSGAVTEQAIIRDQLCRRRAPTQQEMPALGHLQYLIMGLSTFSTAAALGGGGDK